MMTNRKTGIAASDSNIKSGKTTESLLTKLLQDKFRPKLAKTIDRLSRDDFSSSPFAALVDLTPKCNLDCPWCIDRFARLGKEIPTEKMLSLLDEFKKMGILSIVYFGGGEPLMHSGIEKILLKTHRLGIDYAINTNGYFLDRALSVIGKTCSWTRISWDAGSQEAYRDIHRGKDFFDRILKNTGDLVKIAKGTVGISFVIMENNVSEIVKAAEVAKNIGCDFIQFKPEYTPLKSNKRFISYYPDVLSADIKRQLDLAQTEETSSFAVLATGSLRTVLDKKPLNQNKNYTYCAAQQLIPLITPHGVYVCPNWRGAKSKCTGSILHHTFKSVWNGKKRRNIIRQLNPAKECEVNCLRHHINILVNLLLDAKKTNLDLLKYIREVPGKNISDRYFI